MEETLENQSLKQKKILLAQSEHAAVVLEVLKDCTTQLHSIVGKDEFSTLVNALTIEVETNMRMKVAKYLLDIKNGVLHEPG